MTKQIQKRQYDKLAEKWFEKIEKFQKALMNDRIILSICAPARACMVEVVSVEGNLDGTADLTFEVTENVGKKNQKSYQETFRFEIVTDFNQYGREWLRLDEIDDTSLEAYKWAEMFNARQKEA